MFETRQRFTLADVLLDVSNFFVVMTRWRGSRDYFSNKVILNFTIMAQFWEQIGKDRKLT